MSSHFLSYLHSHGTKNCLDMIGLQSHVYIVAIGCRCVDTSADYDWRSGDKSRKYPSQGKTHFCRSSHFSGVTVRFSENKAGAMVRYREIPCYPFRLLVPELHAMVIGIVP